MRSINRLKFNPISMINTGVDVFARVVGPVVSGRMARRKKTLKVEKSDSVQFSSVRPDLRNNTYPIRIIIGMGMMGMGESP
jgi:hypothetical protein